MSQQSNDAVSTTASSQPLNSSTVSTGASLSGSKSTVTAPTPPTAPPAPQDNDSESDSDSQLNAAPIGVNGQLDVQLHIHKLVDIDGQLPVTPKLCVHTHWRGDNSPNPEYFETEASAVKAAENAPMQCTWEEDGVLAKVAGTSFDIDLCIQTKDDHKGLAVARLNLWQIRNSMKMLTPQNKDSLCDFILDLQSGDKIKRKIKGKLHIRAKLIGEGIFDCLTDAPTKQLYYSAPSQTINLKDAAQVFNYLNTAKVFPILHKFMNHSLYFNGNILDTLVSNPDCSVYLKTMNDLPIKEQQTCQQIYASTTASLIHGYYKSLHKKSVVPLKAFVTFLDRIKLATGRHEICELSFMLLDTNHSDRVSQSEFKHMNKQCSILHQMFMKSLLPTVLDEILTEKNVPDDKQIEMRNKVKMEKYFKHYPLQKMYHAIYQFGYKMADTDGDGHVPLFEYTEWFLNDIDQQALKDFAKKAVSDALEEFKTYLLSNESHLRRL